MLQNRENKDLQPIVFKPLTLWAMDKKSVLFKVNQVSGAIYPIMQHLEVVLRNSIDQEARSRFGVYWWRTIAVDTTRQNHNNFKNSMELAQAKLKKDWNKKERARLGLSNTDPLPAGIVVPVFTHDQIVAATDFGTWKEVLISAYHTSNNQQINNYL